MKKEDRSRQPRFLIYKFERNLSKAKPVNKYIRDYVPKKLKWCKKDSLMTYIDQLKYVEFNSGPDVYLDKALVINFDRIHKSIKGAEHKQQFSDRQYFTVYSFYLEVESSQRLF